MIEIIKMLHQAHLQILTFYTKNDCKRILGRISKLFLKTDSKD